MQEIIEIVDINLQKNREKMLLTSVNAAMTVISQNDKLITNAINGSDIVNIDGMSVYYSLKLLGLKIPERIAGPDIFYNLVKLSAQKGYKPFFLGAKATVLDAMIKIFKLEFPSLDIAGYHHGYYDDSNMEAISKMIEDSKADMLFMGITSPKRELFTNKYYHISSVPVWKGVGGSFDIYAKLIKRAPLWIQKIGMEWFFRLCQEPGRMWKRYLITNTVFIMMILGELFRKLFMVRRRVFWE